jgi:Flp pilus assembly protein TadG
MLIMDLTPRLIGTFRRDRRGVSAIEFAFGAPVVILLLLMGVDTTRYITATKRIENVAATIGQMISVNQSGSVAYSDLQFDHDSAMVIFPQVLADAKQRNVAWSNDIGISMASIQFSTASGCTSNCTYVPKMMWSGGSSPRSCTAVLTPVSDTAPPSPTTLPADVFGPGSLIVVDLTFNFRPTIAPRFMSSIPIARSYYVAPRYVPAIDYTVVTGDNGIAKHC